MSATAGNTAADVAIGVCWGAFMVVWIVGAVHSARYAPAVRKRTMGNLRWLLVVAAFVVLRFVPGSDWDRLSAHAWWIRLPGLALLVTATVFTIWSRASLGTMWSSTVVAREGHELRTDGPYGIVRHPIYAGILGMLVGSAMLDGFGRWTLALVAGGVLVLIRVRAEERLMTELFRDEYELYRRRVPALVPLPRRR
jgi:protein-S-isoprenylcysteine O-methyltransferase Ste14